MTNPALLEHQSVQEHEPPTSMGAGFWYALPANDPLEDVLLPEWGLHERDRQLRLLYRNQFNWIAQSATASLIRKFTQTPWQLQGGRNLTNHFQSILQNADFGDGWSDMWSQVLLDYLTCDYGAYIEIIGAGAADGPIRGRVTAIAHLDSLRCIPTGNLEYPVIYWSRRTGKLHRLHHTRVIRLVDMRDGDELRFGAGMCSLSRAVAIIQQQIPMMRYVAGQMSDVPANGVMFLTGLTGKQYYDAMDDYKRRREITGYRGEMAVGATNSGQEIKGNRIPFAVAPEGFDYATYIDIAVNAFSAAFGIDRQDLWPLTGKMAGTATQSEVMVQRAMGMAFGDLLSKVKRAINTKILPASLEFDFEYRDEEKDKQVAERTSILLGNASLLRSLGATDETVMRYLAAQDETLRDVILNADGDIVALPDDDVVEDEQQQIAEDDVTDTESPEADETIETDKAAKEQSLTAFAYIPLVNNREVLRIQRELKERFPDERIDWQIPSTFHVTLCHAQTVTDTAIANFASLLRAEQIELHGAFLDVFETPDGKALHIRLEDTTLLDDVQRHVYEAFKLSADGISPFSIPEAYKPHITLAYMPNDVPFEMEAVSFSTLAYSLEVSRNDYDPVLTLYAPNYIKATKDISDTQAAFIQRFNAMLSDARDGAMNRTRAGTLIRGLIRTFGSRAYGDGMENGGVPRSKMDDGDNNAVARLVATQSQYVSNLTDVLFNQDGITDAQAAGKAVMWFNKSINPFFDGGRMSANANGMYEFKVGNTEHCPDCLALNGQIHRLKEFIQSGWHPKSSRLECKGYRCECELVKRPGAAERGRLPSGGKVLHIHRLPQAA
jgi:2'-5' RNA ligase